MKTSTCIYCMDPETPHGIMAFLSENIEHIVIEMTH